MSCFIFVQLLNLFQLLLFFYSFTCFAGLAVLKHTLTPRVKASHLAVDIMNESLDAVYDVTVAYEGTLDNSGQRKPAPSMAGTSLQPHGMFKEDEGIK